MKRKLISFIILALATVSLYAIPAKPGIWKTLKLANGQTIEVQLRGDEFMKFWQDKDGKNYTMTEKGLVTANMENLVQRSKELRASNQGPYLTRGGLVKTNARTNARQKVSYIGKKRCLIILVQFSNKKFSMADPKAFYNRVANEEGFSEGNFRGSVKDYFHAQSNGQFDLTFDIAGPYTLANYEVYGENSKDGGDKNPQGMVAAACQNAVNDGWNLAPYDWDDDGEVDLVFVLYAGRGEATGGDANTIWPHKYNLPMPTAYGDKKVYTYACSNELASDTRIDGIGTICHEFSHCLGFPDAYDTQYKGFYGMGTWDLMCSGSYNGNSYCPAGYSAYEKYAAGWIEPVELTENVEVTGMATVAKGGNAYKFTNPGFSDEYYIIENRQQEGWDAGLAASGIIINHINYDEKIWEINMPNTNDPEYNQFEHITFIPADNSKKENDEKGDAWPYNGVNALGSKTTPAATTQHENTDGKKLMNISISDIAMAEDKTASFKFINYNVASSQDGYIFHESFDKCQGTGGNDGSFVPPMLSHDFATGTFAPDVEGWTCNYQKGGNQCGRFGTTSAANVTLTSPEFELNGEAKLTFKCAPIGKADVTLNLSAENAELDIQSISMKNGQWNEAVVTVKSKGKTKLTFTSSKAFFLDEVYLQSTTTGIGQLITDAKSSSPYTYVYNAEGQQVCKMKTSEFQKNNIPGNGLFILKCGNKTTKIVK